MDWKEQVKADHAQYAEADRREKARAHHNRLYGRRRKWQWDANQLRNLLAELLPRQALVRKPRCGVVNIGEYLVYLSGTSADIYFAKPLPAMLIRALNKAGQAYAKDRYPRLVSSALIHKPLDVWPALKKLDEEYDLYIEQLSAVLNVVVRKAEWI